MAVDIGPKIGIDGEKEFRKELGNINQQLKTLGSEMKRAVSAFELGEDAEEALTEQKEILNKQIDTQREKLSKLTKGLDDAKQKYGESDQVTQKWAQAVADASTDLNKMQRELKKANGELDDMDDNAKDAKLSLDDISSTIVKGFAVGAVVNGVKELGSALMGVVTETQEYRTIMASLENSSQRAGYTAEQTSATYTQLFGVLGDSQAAATATANLQALGLNQKQLTELTNAAIGAWATYGDSIPIDGLAEAVNETIRCGQVTGVFADVLNWGSEEGETFGVTMRESTKANEEWNKQVEACETAEDYFNLALSQCTTQAERQNLMMKTLAKGGLTEAGKAWQQNNKDIVAVNEATAEYEAALADLGEALAPVAAALLRFAADAIGEVISAVKEAADWFDTLFRKAKDTTALTTGLAADAARSSVSTASNANDEAALMRRMKQTQSVSSGQSTSTSAAGTGAKTEITQITVQSVLDGRVIGQAVSTYQKNQMRMGVQ